MFWILHASVSSFPKKELFGAGYPLVWYRLKQSFTLVLVKSGKILLFISLLCGLAKLQPPVFPSTNWINIVPVKLKLQLPPPPPPPGNTLGI